MSQRASDLGNPRNGFLTPVPVQPTEPFGQIRIIMSDHLQVTFEDCMVCSVKSGYCSIQSNACVRDVIAKEIRSLNRIQM